MNDKPVEAAWSAPATYDFIEGRWPVSPVDLSVPSSGRDMPDVQLEALCDIIFADLKLTSVPQRK